MGVELTNSQLQALSNGALAQAKKVASGAGSAATSTAASAAGAGTGNGSGNALASLSSNYNDFLTMFTTQLKDQDPDSPMDSNQFTSELVQFSSVEQQVQTNTNLTQLIQLTQGADVGAASATVGKNVQVSGNVVPLQNGKATVDFTASAAEPIAISVVDANGNDVRDVALTSSAGANAWTWDGTSNTGRSLPDGPYNVSVRTGDALGNVADVPFTSVATPTAVSKSGNSIDYSFGPTVLDESKVQALSG